MNDLEYKIGYRVITSSQYHKFLPIKEVRIDKDKFSVIGKINSEYNIVESYYIYLYSENEQLLELSKIHDTDAKEFVESLFLEVIALFEKESDEAYEKARIEEHNKAVELINKLK